MSIEHDDIIETLRDLDERLAGAEVTLAESADGARSTNESLRLNGKHQGVSLARSYVQEALREAERSAIADAAAHAGMGQS